MGFFDRPDIDFGRVFSHLFQLAVAFLLALPVAWDREQEECTLGLRTFPPVAMARVGYIQISQVVLGVTAAELSRIVQGPVLPGAASPAGRPRASWLVA